MILICKKGHTFNVRGCYYWKYPNRVNKCPKCGLRGRPDKSGEKELRSRHLSMNEHIRQ